MRVVVAVCPWLMMASPHESFHCSDPAVSLARPEAEPTAEIGASGFGPIALNETPLPFKEAALEEFDAALPNESTRPARG
jgi:hypothetical protein